MAQKMPGTPCLNADTSTLATMAKPNTQNGTGAGRPCFMTQAVTASRTNKLRLTPAISQSALSRCVTTKGKGNSTSAPSELMFLPMRCRDRPARSCRISAPDRRVK